MVRIKMKYLESETLEYKESLTEFKEKKEKFLYIS
jgi:hypothetical protein